MLWEQDVNLKIDSASLPHAFEKKVSNTSSCSYTTLYRSVNRILGIFE
jgi:hypothetical protein